jgi:hypothetical protein
MADRRRLLSHVGMTILQTSDELRSMPTKAAASCTLSRRVIAASAKVLGITHERCRRSSAWPTCPPFLRQLPEIRFHLVSPVGDCLAAGPRGNQRTTASRSRIFMVDRAYRASPSAALRRVRSVSRARLRPKAFAARRAYPPPRHIAAAQGTDAGVGVDERKCAGAKA